MSVNHPTSKAKIIIFDAILFTYSLVVAGYLFALVSPSLVNLDQDFFIAHFYGLALATGLIFIIFLVAAMGLQKTQAATVGDALFANSTKRQKIQEKPFFRSCWGIHVLLVFALTTIVAIQVTQASLYELLDREGLAGAWRLSQGLIHPNFAILARAVIETIETVLIAFLATLIAIPIAFVLAFFSAKNIMSSPSAAFVYAILRIGMNISRSIEPLIWALIFTVWVGVGPFAGMLALMVHSVASLMKYYSEILESVDEGPIDGLRSTGASQAQVIWFAIIPQIVLPYIAMTIYRWDTNVRMATVIGLVGGGGIGTLLVQYQGQAMWPEVGCIILVIAVVVWAMDLASAYVREALK